jgi:uncharacterized phage protein (TIGR01671 family)
MMREIKFRAWDIESPGMLSWEEIQEEWESEGYHPAIFNQDHYHCMQFTGLLDKNGKEIYAGDVVRHVREVYAPDNYQTGEAAFEEYQYTRKGVISITTSKGVVINGYQERHCVHEGDFADRRKYNENPGSYSDYAEIIGNIHENPELMDPK